MRAISPKEIEARVIQAIEDVAPQNSGVSKGTDGYVAIRILPIDKADHDLVDVLKRLIREGKPIGQFYEDNLEWVLPGQSGCGYQNQYKAALKVCAALSQCRLHLAVNKKPAAGYEPYKAKTPARKDK